MGSTCSKNSFSRGESKKVLNSASPELANLDETIGQDNYEVNQRQRKRETIPEKQDTKKQSSKEHWSNSSTGAVAEKFQTKTLKMDCPIADLVKLPPNTNEYVWIYEKAQFYWEECRLLFESISDVCNPTTCPEMTAGPHYTYLWTDEYNCEPRSMSANSYISNTLLWTKSKFQSDDFAEITYGVFPDYFMATMKTVFKKLFRIYAHVYHHHLNEFIKLKAEIHLNTSFKYFGMFVREFQLISKKEEAPLRKLLQQLINENDQKLDESGSSSDIE